MTFSGSFRSAFSPPFGGGAAASLVLFYDTFTDADFTLLASHTPDIDVVGGGWTNPDTSRFSIYENHAATSTLLGGRSWAFCNVGVVNFKASCDIRLVGSEGIVVRALNVNNFWMGQQTTNLLNIFERTSGTFFIRSSAVVVTSMNTIYSQSVTASGNDITYVHSLGTLTYNSAQHNTNTRAGIRGSAALITQESFDNFMVEQI